MHVERFLAALDEETADLAAVSLALVGYGLSDLDLRDRLAARGLSVGHVTTDLHVAAGWRNEPDLHPSVIALATGRHRGQHPCTLSPRRPPRVRAGSPAVGPDAAGAARGHGPAGDPPAGPRGERGPVAAGVAERRRGLPRHVAGIASWRRARRPPAGAAAARHLPGSRPPRVERHRRPTPEELQPGAGDRQDAGEPARRDSPEGESREPRRATQGEAGARTGRDDSARRRLRRVQPSRLRGGDRGLQAHFATGPAPDDGTSRRSRVSGTVTR